VGTAYLPPTVVEVIMQQQEKAAEGGEYDAHNAFARNSNTNSGKNCRRVWCGTAVGGWLVGIFLFLIALALVFYSRHLEKKKESQKKDNQEQETQVQTPVTVYGETPTPSSPHHFFSSTEDRLVLMTLSPVANGVTTNEKYLGTIQETPKKYRSVDINHAGTIEETTERNQEPYHQLVFHQNDQDEEHAITDVTTKTVKVETIPGDKKAIDENEKFVDEETTSVPVMDTMTTIISLTSLKASPEELVMTSEQSSTTSDEEEVDEEKAVVEDTIPEESSSSPSSKVQLKYDHEQDKYYKVYQDPWENVRVNSSDNLEIKKSLIINTNTNGDAENLGSSILGSSTIADLTNAKNESNNNRTMKYETPGKKTQDIENNSYSNNYNLTVKTNTSKPKKEFLGSLGLARMLASQHIVFGHLFAKGAFTTGVYFFSWGYTWVPWFFMLSGYVLCHARLNSTRKGDDPLSHIAKRLSNIFPMYAFGVFLTLIIRVSLAKKLPSMAVLMGQSFLLQSWNPLWTEHAMVSQCWFLSNLLIYWGCFGWFQKNLQNISLRNGWIALTVISLLPYLLMIVPAIVPSIEFNWYSEHEWGHTDTALDIWTVLLKFHPIFYVHVFIYGMLLAVVRHRVKQLQFEQQEIYSKSVFTYWIQRTIEFLSRYGATLGYFGLILIFTVRDIKPASNKLSARLSVLLPLQGMVLLGLSPLPSSEGSKWWQLKQDPLAILFRQAPSLLGDMSYCQYVLQFAMYELFPLTKIRDPSFFLYLWGASLLCYKLIQEPAARAWRNFLPPPKKSKTSQNIEEKMSFLSQVPSLSVIRLLLLPAGVLAVILAIAKGSYTPSKSLSSSSASSFGNNNIGDNIDWLSLFSSSNATSIATVLIPKYIRIAEEAIDVQLNWTMDISDEGDELVPINPSILFLPSLDGSMQWVRAVRAHNVTSTTTVLNEDSTMVTEQLLQFKSRIMLRAEPLTNFNFASWNVDDWRLDGDEPLVSINEQIVSHRGRDTRWTDLCEQKPDYNIESNYRLRKQVDGPEDPKLLGKADGGYSISFSSYPPSSLFTFNGERNSCPDIASDRDETNNAALDVVTMQMYLVDDGAALETSEGAQGVRLDCGIVDGTEKNWIAFEYESKLYYIYSIEPHHRIVHVRPSDGACVELYSTEPFFLTKMKKQKELSFRGSATAIRYSYDEYLALLHTHHPSRGYTTMAYTFESKPPFAIQRISKPLPLHPRAFASSLSLTTSMFSNKDTDKIWIGYGDADTKSRVLVLSRKYMEEEFMEWC